MEAGDRLYVMVRAQARAQLERLLDRWEHGPLAPPPERAPDDAAGVEAALPDRGPVAQRHSLALGDGPPLVVEVRPDGAVTLAASGSDRLRVTLRLDQARALADELIGGGSGSAARAGVIRRTALPGIGERLQIEAADGALTLILNRWEGVYELFLGDGEPDRVAVLGEDERRRLGALLLAATRSGASG